METESTTPDFAGRSPDEPSRSGPLDDQHYAQLALAKDLALPIRRASRVAAFNGWVTAIIAALSLPFAISGWVALVVAVGLSIVAYMEFRGRKQLLQFNPSAASLLGWNQVGLLTLIVVYCCWMLFGGAADLQESPELSQLLGAAGRDLYRSILVLFYGTVIALSVIFQGGNAIYYFTRRQHINAYLQQTSQWVRDLQGVNSNG